MTLRDSSEQFILLGGPVQALAGRTNFSFNCYYYYLTPFYFLLPVFITFSMEVPSAFPFASLSSLKWQN